MEWYTRYKILRRLRLLQGIGFFQPVAQESVVQESNNIEDLSTKAAHCGLTKEQKLNTVADLGGEVKVVDAQQHHERLSSVEWSMLSHPSV